MYNQVNFEVNSLIHVEAARTARNPGQRQTHCISPIVNVSACKRYAIKTCDM